MSYLCEECLRYGLKTYVSSSCPVLMDHLGIVPAHFKKPLIIKTAFGIINWLRGGLK